MDEPETSQLGDIERKLREAEIEDIKSLGVIFKKKIKDNEGVFSEKVTINPNGSLKLEDEDGNLKSLFVHNAQEGPEDLLKLAKKVEEVLPELSFDFERDKSGRVEGGLNIV